MGIKTTPSLFVIFTTLILFAVCALPVKGQTTQVLDAGKTFLLSKGIPADSLQLEEVVFHDECHVLENRLRYGGWVIVADEQYHKFLSSPVLAFSTRGYFGKSIHKFHQRIFADYATRLKEIKQNGTDSDSLMQITRNWQTVQPLLGDIAWNQCDLPINFGEKSVHVKSGCVGTAEAQLLKYWSHPDHITGNVEFMVDSVSRKYLLCRVDGMTLTWQTFPAKMTYDKKKRYTLERLQAVCSMTLCASHGAGATSAFSDQLKYSMVHHFGFSTRMKMLHKSQIRVSRMFDMAYADLLARRVVYMGCMGHAFLLDGYTDGMFHLNLGWGGIRNGYYRPFADEHLQMITGIEPEHAADVPIERLITVKKAGTLAELLPEEEAMKVAKLTIIGKLNANDWQLVRRMSGAVSTDDPSLPIGRLQELDLSGAHFVTSKQWFLRLPAHTISLSGYFYKTDSVRIGKDKYTNSKTVNYDMRNLSHKVFTELKEFDTQKHDFILEEEIPDTIYWVQLVLQEDRLPTRMFANCDNLRKIIFGKNIYDVRSNCFMDCTNLEHLEFRARNITFSEGAFWGARRLKSIATYSRSNLKSSMFKRIFAPSLEILTPSK